MSKKLIINLVLALTFLLNNFIFAFAQDNELCSSKCSKSEAKREYDRYLNLNFNNNPPETKKSTDDIVTAVIDTMNQAQL